MPLLKQNWRCCRCVQFKWKKNYNQGQEKSEDESDSDEDCEDKDRVPMAVRSMKVLKKKWGVFAHEQISVAVAAMLDNGQNDRTSIHMQRYGYCNCSKSLITSHTAYLMMQRVQSVSEPTGQKHGPPSHLPVTELWASPSHLHFAGLSPSHLPFIKPQTKSPLITQTSLMARSKYEPTATPSCGASTKHNDIPIYKYGGFISENSGQECFKHEGDKKSSESLKHKIHPPTHYFKHLFRPHPHTASWLQRSRRFTLHWHNTDRPIWLSRRENQYYTMTSPLGQRMLSRKW